MLQKAVDMSPLIRMTGSLIALIVCASSSVTGYAQTSDGKGPAKQADTCKPASDTRIPLEIREAAYQECLIDQHRQSVKPREKRSDAIITPNDANMRSKTQAEKNQNGTSICEPAYNRYCNLKCNGEYGSYCFLGGVCDPELHRCVKGTP